jgi:ATP-dependent DNA helicase RecG
MPEAAGSPLEAPLTTLSGVGAERAAQFTRLKLATVGDLLLHRPRRYEDRTHFATVAELVKGEPAAALGTIIASGVKRFSRGNRSVFEFILDDGHSRLHCRWWNAPYMKNFFKPGDQVAVYGKPVSLKPATMDHPETEILEEGDESSIHLGRVVPVYPLTEGLSQRWLRALVWRAVEQLESQIEEPRPEISIDDLPTRANAIHMLHFPEEWNDPRVARQRLALDEFIEFQLQIQQRRHRLEANASPLPCVGDNRLIKPFLAGLAFNLTDAQNGALREIRVDMTSDLPMRRLLQGDVGSGKTVVAASAALMAMESGFNVALMAPTEILAEQHYATFKKWFQPLGITVHLRTGSKKTDLEKDQANLDLAPDSDADSQPSPNSQPTTLTIGTHALIEASFEVDNLGLVIIDEQHKFGVKQRDKLLRKGSYPHLLVMTATPIPRTLGLTLYGDLDTSVIADLPPGRGRVRTFVRKADRLPRVWDFIRDKLAEGRQVYIVYPRVNETDNSNLKAVTREFKKIQAEVEPHQAGLLHGQLDSEAKDAVMTAFRNNEIQALLATSVIEVGVDVPNATVMLIENAEQFGLAQLHQLRGRIGRGGDESFCILVADLKTEEARQRLNFMEETNDGFRIAEFDLQQRGPGELLGRDQSGLPPFKFGDLRTDLKLIDRARKIVKASLGRA